MLVRIADSQTIYIDQVTPIEESYLTKAFSVKSPRARYIDTTMGNFDGWYRKYNNVKKKLNRALLGELRKVCHEHNLPLTIVDEREPAKYPSPNPSTVGPDFLPGITLEDYQVRAIQAACGAEVGLVQAPTGSGKGELIAAYAKLFDCPTVVIAEQKVVILQLKERLELREVVEEAGLFMAGKRPNGQLVICGSIASLIIPSEPQKTQKDTAESYARKLKGYRTRRRNAYLLRKMIAKCDLLLVDEADKAVNQQYRQLFRFWFRGRRKYGFSGTFFDPATPVQNLHLRENLGSIIALATREEVQATGRTIPVEYNAIAFGDPKNKNSKEAWDVAITQYMVENPLYHRLIVSLAAKSIRNPGYGTLVLVDSIPLGITLDRLMKEKGLPSEFIYGDTSDQKRSEIIKSFEERKTRILIGSKILKRGLDLDGGCESLIIACDDQRWSEFNQIIGRAVRRNRVGKGIIYDTYFLCNHYLYEHSRSRVKHVAQTDFKGRVIFPNAIISVHDFIRSRFRIPK